ncbi:MAG TPA: hypothetical protein VGX71_27770 [Pseudaminobacter sp.]|nr:hypothetical protein [Pseudaminobacter sp.]
MKHHRNGGWQAYSGSWPSSGYIVPSRRLSVNQFRKTPNTEEHDQKLAQGCQWQKQSWESGHSTTVTVKVYRDLHEICRISLQAAFTALTNLQPSPVKHNTGFPLFPIASGDFSRLSRAAM